MSKKFRKIDNFNLSLTIPAYSKIMSTGSEKTRKLELFSQIPESYLRMNRFESISQNSGEILGQFSRINENELGLCTDVFLKKKYPGKESPHILIK